MNDKKNGLGIFMSKNNNSKVIGNFRENNVVGLSVILKESDDFDKGNICIMENGKKIPCTKENEINNLKLHQEYKDLKLFYQRNFENFKNFLRKL